MGPRVSETGTVTTIVLALIALFAIVTVIGIVRGMRLKRRRNRADRLERERIEADGGTMRVDHAPLGDDDATDQPAPTPPRDAPEPHRSAVDAPTPQPEGIADEPIAAAAPLAATPASEAQVPPPDPAPASPPPPPPPAGPPPGDAPVTRIKGLGPKVATLLGEQGIATVGQLAALDDRAAQNLDAHLGAFTGRMARDRWIEQARLLAAGDFRTFEERFGKL